MTLLVEKFMGGVAGYLHYAKLFAACENTIILICQMSLVL